MRNFHQTRRQILYGFMLSLISKDLLGKYTWSGRSEKQSTKFCFENLKQIHGVFWGALLRIIPKYTVKELEDDMKKNLYKCAIKAKEIN